MSVIQNICSGPTFPLELYLQHSQEKAKFFIHAGVEIPDLINGQELQKGKTYTLMVTISQLETDVEAMASLSPEKRNCLAGHERDSKIFRNYTQVPFNTFFFSKREVSHV